MAEEGLHIGPGDLAFKRVFDHVESTTGTRLTNASVIRRVWEDQADFQTDVLMAIASNADSAGELDRTVEVMGPLLVTFDLGTPTSRMAALRELARVGGEVGMRSRMETRDWSLWVGVWVLVVTSPPTARRSRIRDALEQGLATVTDVWEQLFAGICTHLGIRVVAPLTLRQFTTAVSAMVEGSALRQGGDPELEIIRRPTGPRGALQDWTLFGVGLDALASRFFEIDPGWQLETQPGAAAPPG